jgi:molybdopterin-guanine dinucleotide biosynthesis protein B
VALGRYRKILQIVGYSGSGKTTLMENLISQAAAQGLRVGAIKHHGHGGIPEEFSKDNVRHEQAGACVAAVEGHGTLRLSIHQESWTLDEILMMYDLFNLDLILIEGYKQERFRKVILLRSPEEMELLEKLSNILCVIHWPTCVIEKKMDYPVFSIDEEERYIKFLMEEWRGNHGNVIV